MLILFVVAVIAIAALPGSLAGPANKLRRVSAPLPPSSVVHNDAARRAGRALSPGFLDGQSINFAPLSSALLKPATLFPQSLSIDTFAATSGNCGTTAKSSFNLAETVCVKVSGAPTSGAAIIFGDPDNFQRGEALPVTTSSQSFLFDLPSSKTTGDVDNRGTWTVAIVSTVDNTRRASVNFTVHDPTQAVADVTISKTSLDEGQVTAGSNATYRVYVTNQGPDDGTNVSFTDNTLPNTTFVSFTQDNGPTFNCTSPAAGEAGSTTCTRATMAAGATASFTAVYKVNSSVTNGSNLTDTVGVTSDTTDSRPSSNSSTVETTASNPTPPTCTLTCPNNITAIADTVEDVNGQPTSGKHVTLPDAQATGTTCGTVTSSIASGSFFPLGSTPVTYTAADGASCSFIVTVTESGAPVTISCPANVTVNAGASCEATVALGTPTTTGDNVSVTNSRSDGKLLTAPFPTGTTTVTWTATNSSGTESCTQTVTVIDVTPPVINVPTPAPVSADANCLAAIPDLTGDPHITDNCACDSSDSAESCVGHAMIAITQSPAPGTMVGPGQHTITLTANDGSDNNNGAGNTTTAQVIFTVNDTTAPTFTSVPASVTANTGAGATTCDAIVDVGTATASDNCGTVNITRSPSGNTFPVGNTTVTWTATDGAGNTTTATQTVTVIDNTPPVISCPTNITVYLPLHSTATSMAVTYPPATATDNCGGTTIAYSVASGSVFSVGTTPVTATATDTHGNSASCTFTVTVLYDFTGFFSPVGNIPTLNVVSAGRAVPVKFSLSGNKGLSIFTANSPQSGVIPCDASAPATDLTDTVTAGSSSLSYDATSDQYIYTWKTDSTWTGCRQLIVTLNDGSSHVANFKFK